MSVGRGVAYTMNVFPYYDAPDIPVEYLFYRISPDAPLAPPTPFGEGYWDRKEPFYKPVGLVGCDPQSIKEYYGVLPPPNFNTRVGSDADFLNGVSYAQTIATGGCPDIPCFTKRYIRNAVGTASGDSTAAAVLLVSGLTFGNSEATASGRTLANSIGAATGTSLASATAQIRFSAAGTATGTAVATAAPPTTLNFSTFTAANGTNVINFVPEIGGSWTSAGSGVPVIQSNQLQMTNTMSAYVPTGGATGSVQVLIANLNANAPGIIWGVQNNSNYLFANVTNSQLTIGYTSAGSPHSLVTSGVSFSASTSGNMMVYHDANNYKVWFGGVVLSTSAFNYNPARTSAGLFTNSGTGVFDNFTAYSP